MARQGEGFHDKVNNYVFDLERDGLGQVVPRKGSITNSKTVCLTWRGMGMARLYLGRVP